MSDVIETVKSLYQQVGMNFQADLERFMREGYVFIGPEYFVMGCRSGDAWYIQAMAGRRAMEMVVKLMPYYLPLVGFRRMKHGNDVRWYSTEKLIRKVKYATS